MSFFKLSIFLIPRSLMRNKLHGFRRMIIHIFHIPSTSFAPDLQCRIEFFQPFTKGIHTQYTSQHHGRACRQSRRSLEYLGIVLKHSFGYPPVLPHTQRSQISPMSLGIFPHQRHSFADIFSQSGQSSGLMRFLENINHCLIILFRLNPSGTVSCIMTDIERFIPFRRRSRDSFLYRISIVHSSRPGYIFQYSLTGGLGKTIQVNATQTEEQDTIFKKHQCFHIH